MPIQQLSCDFKHLSIPVHLGPCRSHPCSRTSTEGAAVHAGTGWRRGGGPATWTRWSMARASASTLDDVRAERLRGPSRSRRLPATTSRAQWGCIGAPNGATDERCRTGRRLGEQAARRTARGARRLAPKTKNEPVPGVLLPCSLTVLSCEARRRREMTL